MVQYCRVGYPRANFKVQTVLKKLHGVQQQKLCAAENRSKFERVRCKIAGKLTKIVGWTGWFCSQGCDRQRYFLQGQRPCGWELVQLVCASMTTSFLMEFVWTKMYTTPWTRLLQIWGTDPWNKNLATKCWNIGMVSRPIVQLMTRNNVEHSFVFSRNIFWLKLTQMIFILEFSPKHVELEGKILLEHLVDTQYFWPVPETTVRLGIYMLRSLLFQISFFSSHLFPTVHASRYADFFRRLRKPGEEGGGDPAVPRIGRLPARAGLQSPPRPPIFGPSPCTPLLGATEAHLQPGLVPRRARRFRFTCPIDLSKCHFIASVAAFCLLIFENGLNAYTVLHVISQGPTVIQTYKILRFLLANSKQKVKIPLLGGDPNACIGPA